MHLHLIKLVLSLAGIHKLVVRFDDPNRQIVATFTKNSQPRTEFIKFTDLEDLFTGKFTDIEGLFTGPIQAHSGPRVDAKPEGARLHHSKQL